MPPPLLSVVLPIYNEAKNIPELYARLKKALAKITAHELIFINDGSRDESLKLLKKLSARDQKIKILDFSRNFGHQIAITAGLDYAEGDAVVIMDTDLQDPPEVLPELLKKWRAGFEVVYAKRRQRQDGLFKKLTAFIFYRLLRSLANIEIPEDAGDFRLLDRKAVNEMKKLREHSRFMRGLTSWVGFRQTAVLFDRSERKHGVTAYPFRKMLKFALDGVFSFSYVPLRLATYLGIFCAFVSFIVGLYAVWQKIFTPERTVPGWASLFTAVFFMGGIQLLILGVIGEYLGRIYTETQGRPLYVVRERVNFKK